METGNAVADSEVPQVPFIAYTLVAAALTQEDLPSLRLVSKAWCYAADRAVRRYGKKHGWLTPAQLDNLHIAALKFSGLKEIDLTFIPHDRTSQCFDIDACDFTSKHRSILYCSSRARLEVAATADLLTQLASSLFGIFLRGRHKRHLSAQGR